MWNFGGAVVSANGGSEKLHECTTQPTSTTVRTTLMRLASDALHF
jgi:hypothetical protein